MSLSAYLRNVLSRHRRRKQPPLGGAASGIDYGRNRSGSAASGYPYNVPPASRAQDYTISDARAYEPHPGFADLAQPDYEAYRPSPVSFPHTPTIRSELPDMPVAEPRPPAYDAALLTPELFKKLMSGLLHEGEDEPSVPLVSEFPPDEAATDAAELAGLDADPYDHEGLDDAVDRLDTEERSADGLEHLVNAASVARWQDDAMLPDDASDQAIDEAADHLASPAAVDPVAQAQEIFEQQMQTFDRMATPPAQPEYLDPYAAQQQMYDEQMQQLMNPFGMPGPMG